MLRSQTLQLRQSEIRSRLAEIQANDELDDEQRAELDKLTGEYRGNETELRACLISEEHERQQHAPQDTQARERRNLLEAFEVRQAVRALTESTARLSGPTAELVEELRGAEGANFQGIPIPLAALAPEMELRVDTTSAGTPDPIQTAPIIDRIFAGSVADRMGFRTVNLSFGDREWPIASAGAVFNWTASEGSDLAEPVAYVTGDVSISPDFTAGCRITLTRQSMKQSGVGLEAAVRRDMRQSIREGLDRTVFLGSGAAGEFEGVFNNAGITSTAVAASAAYSVFLDEAIAFMTANTISSMSDVRILSRPELVGFMDAAELTGTSESTYDRLVRRLGAPVLSSNAVAAPAGPPLAVNALLTVNTGGVAPGWLGIWGGVDLIRDEFTLAASGSVALTGLITADFAVSRPIQTRILTDLQLA